LASFTINTAIGLCGSAVLILAITDSIVDMAMFISIKGV
jgi:hypothetical protein